MQNFIKTIINAIKSWTIQQIPKKLTELENDLYSEKNKIPGNMIDVMSNAEMHDAFRRIDNAQATANNAQATADNAQATADSAQATANNKMDAANPVGTGSFSMNRKSGTFVGYSSHAEGRDTTASGDYSHAEGADTVASGRMSHTEGSMTIASGNNAHAEGYSAKASGFHSHAEGIGTTASGDDSHAEGGATTASGDNSHAEGNFTTASGNCSHAEGSLTTAVGLAQHVQGEYNVLDTATQAHHRAKYAHIVGNGTSEDGRSNAHTLDWSGNAWYQGDIYVGSTSGTNMDEGSKKLATEEFVSSKIAEAELGGEEVDLSGYALKSELPSRVSQLQNDSGYITGYTETDPTVPAWAKADTKPSYTKAEIGLGNVDNVKQYSTNNPPVLVRSEAPEDKSVIWVDPDDESKEEALEIKESIIAEYGAIYSSFPTEE